MEAASEISPQGVSEAREVIQSLLKAKKNLRLYPANNPMYIQMVENTYQRFRNFLESNGSLDLGITRSDIFLGGESVYHEEGKDDNLALFFFRDGLRSLGFDQALESDELRDFLQILSTDFDDESVEDDIVTLLWEKDFRHIRYTVDDSALAEYEDYEVEAVRQAKEGASEDENIQRAYEEALGTDDMDVAPQMPITEADLRNLALEVQRNAGSKTGKLAEILFNMLYLAESVDEFKDVARILNNAVEFSVRHGNLRDASLIFRRVTEIMKNTGSEEIRRALGTVLTNAGSPVLVKFIGELIDSREGLKEDDFRQYVVFLDVNAIPPLMETLGELRTISGRRNIVNALAYLGRRDVTALIRGLRNERWFVVRNIIHVLRLVGNRKAVEPLVRTSVHPDPRVRKEVMRALGELGGQLSAQTAQTYLDDADRTVRIAAVRALGSIGSEYAKVVVLDRVRDRRILNLDFQEMKENFEVLSQWKSDDVVELLVGVLGKSPFFGRSKFNEYKACAIYSLGMIGRKEPLGEIEKLRWAKNGLIAESAEQAFKRLSNAGK